MVGYFDSSSVLGYVLEGTTDLTQPLSLGDLFSSELLGIECRRAILREQIRRRLSDEAFIDAYEKLSWILGRVNSLELSQEIKQRAGEAFPLHVKTLDALHLATALAVKAELNEEVVVFSRDQRMNRCAKALGLAAPWYS